MVFNIVSALKDFSHLLFPHHCEGCGTDVVDTNQLLCIKCIQSLPETNFFNSPGNPVEKIFYGRTKIQHAGASFYFTKDSLLQHLLIQLKYRNNKEAGIALGKLTGLFLKDAERFSGIDALVPLPLNPKKEARRGYNQATVICNGITSVISKPVIPDAVERVLFTETQTKQDRLHRWQNMQHVFSIKNPKLLKDKHVLLVDDVVTTGATLEACASVISTVEGCMVSIATTAYTI
ncbi:MAG: ComF family protein [Sphingobacteriia bacterium]|nr:ComF family protein [Sphingobacteriia bacterium]